MQIGYARVSTLEQNVHPQIDQLKQAGCERIFRDKASGAKTQRPGLQEALDFLREGDSLVVWRLDRLGRSLKHLLETVSMLEEKGALDFAAYKNPSTQPLAAAVSSSTSSAPWPSLNATLSANGQWLACVLLGQEGALAVDHGSSMKRRVNWPTSFMMRKSTL